MKYIRLLLIGLVSWLVLWGIKTTYFTLTDGFTIANITSLHSDSQVLDVGPLTSLEEQEINEVLSQEFNYLAKGNHSYVFESDDGKYVIKFLQFQKYRNHPLINFLPLPASLDAIRQKKTIHKEEKRDTLLASWKTAFTRLREETQLVYVHLNRSKPINKTIKIYNKCGLPYEIDLNKHVFMLQKKVNMLAPILEKFIANDDLNGAKRMLDALLELYKKGYGMGLYEDDRYILRNTGVINDRPIHLDIDRFRENPELKENLGLQRAHLAWKTELLVKWLEKKYPELSTHLKERLEQLVKG